MSKPTEMMKEYFDIHAEYTRKFGKDTVVIMKVGSFWEIYQVDTVGLADRIGEQLDMRVVLKNNNNPESYKNPKMMGFPHYRLDNYISKLIDAGFVIVKVDQFDQDPTMTSKKSKQRKVTNVYTSGTYIDNYTKSNKYFVGITFENVQSKNYIYFCAIDLTTGTIKTIEMVDTEENPNDALNNFERHMFAFSPSEVLIQDNHNDLQKQMLSFITCPVKTKQINPIYKKIVYQQEFLKKLFGGDDFLERYPELRTTLVYTTQYIYEQDPTILQRLNIPEIIIDDNILNLNNDAIYQLNLVTRGNKSLIDILDKTKTAMGKRLLNERLLRPSSDPLEINARYELIERVKNNYNDIQLIVKGVCDMEKRHRSALLQKLPPNQFSVVYKSYLLAKELLKNNIETIDTCILYNAKNKCVTVLKRFTAFLNKCDETFNFAKMEDDKDCTVNFFVKNLYPDIDEMEGKMDDCKRQLNDICQQIEQEVAFKGSVSMECTDSEYYFSCTVKRAAKLDKEIYKITNLTHDAKITTEKSRHISGLLKQYEKDMHIFIQEHYTKHLTELLNGYKVLLRQIIKIVSAMDIGCSSAQVANEFAYHRPTIHACDNDLSSYISCSDIRHPIIERNDSCQYIGNDLYVGNENGKYGIILYGLNASGKSSLLRSIGCNVIMAQAGLYVASKTFTYYPFKDLVCKISCSDNLYKGDSTYITELKELNNILRKTSKNTLIIADELCNGTESKSASSLVLSTSEYLISKKTTFVISTHMHEIVSIPDLKSNSAVMIAHMHVNIDRTDVKHLINYTYKLAEYSGDELYGLEVASASFSFPQEFIKRAYDVRKILTHKNHEFLSTKQSRYNSDVFMDVCEVCGTTKDLQTHHIHEQQTADTNGIINDRFHKNAKFNLQVLCRNCHFSHHNSSHHSETSSEYLVVSP